MSKVLKLEGMGMGSSDDIELIKSGLGEDVEIITYGNLYYDPKQLNKITVDNPDYIYINSTGLYKDGIKELINRFKDTGFIPKNVIFGWIENSSKSIPTEIIDYYKEQGTKFWEVDETNGKLIEVFK
jgi:hypothetical protein